VLTPNGFKKVTETFKYTTKEVVELVAGGEKIVCTPYHKVFTSKGLVSADAIGYDHHVLTEKDGELCKAIGSHGREINLGFKDYFLSMKPEQLSILMDTDTRKMNMDIGWGVELGKQVVRPFIERCGSIITDMFHMVCTSITRMKINQIITFPTLSLCIQASMRPFTLRMKEEPCYGMSILKQSEKRQNGTRQKPEGSGMLSTERRHSNPSHLSIRNARSVVKHTNQNGPDRLIARMRAGQQVEDNQVLMTKIVSVWSVDQNSNATNTPKEKPVVHVVGQCLDTEVEVYDFSVIDDNCYYANGILVSNSNHADAFRYMCHAITKIETVSNMGGSLKRHQDAVSRRRFQI
jgi:hypothetical protein